jgi:hypothetical protein
MSNLVRQAARLPVAAAGWQPAARQETFDELAR